MYKVAIVDDNKFEIRELTDCISKTYIAEVVFTATNSVHLFRWLHSKEVKPDIILVDIMMDYIDGVTTTLALGRQFSEIKTIAVSDTERENIIRQMLNVGAYDFINKLSLDPNIVKSTLIKVYKQPYQAVLPISDHFTANSELRLSSREIEYLVWLGTFLNDSEIAHLMGVHPRSVDNYAKSIKEKTNIDCKRALARWAIRQGFSKILVF
ncbi:MAG: response regulator [Hydrotalea sp.]|nr:response regulator [Hydrotalea sp.]